MRVSISIYLPVCVCFPVCLGHNMTRVKLGWVVPSCLSFFLRFFQQFAKQLFLVGIFSHLQQWNKTIAIVTLFGQVEHQLCTRQKTCTIILKVSKCCISCLQLAQCLFSLESSVLSVLIHNPVIPFWVRDHMDCLVRSWFYLELRVHAA